MKRKPRSMGVMPPLITIITPTFNRAALLPQAIESVLAQSYSKIEYIVIDDGSTDSTPALLDKYRKCDRVRTYRQRNLGVSQSFNRGVALARGEYVGILGSDDVLTENAIEHAVSALVRTPSAVAAHGDVRVIDEFDREQYIYGIGNLQLPDCLRWWANPATTGVLYRRVDVGYAGGWQQRFAFGPDVDFWFRLGLRGCFVYLPEVLGTMRIHENSITGGPRDSLKLAMEYVEIARQFFARHDLPNDVRDVRASSLRAAFYCAGVVVGGSVNQSRDRHEIRDRCAPVFQHVRGSSFP